MRDMQILKFVPKFINKNEYIVDFGDISKYIYKTCTLVQTLSLAWLLEPTGANLRASGALV